MNVRKWLSGCLAAAMIFSVSASALALPAEQAAERFPHRYTQGGFEMTKISHPDKPANTHQAQVKYADGLLDYVGDGVLGVPGVDEGANGQGDRGQSYSWGSIAHGDWMYVSTLYSAMLSTMQLAPAIGHSYDPELLAKMADTLYRGDFFTAEEDGGNPRCALSKINVKTGEVKIIMSTALNGISGQFRNAVEYHGKLYFCGSPNGIPSIWEIDPETDEFRRAYVDPVVEKDPSVILQAIKEKNLSVAIRGMTVFNDYLVISCVGPDANPYIAVSNNIDEGFTKIASAWKEGTDNTVEGELLGYPACRLRDSIYGGHIWELIPFNGKLYVSICTGTPENSPDGGKTMQSFALMRGECPSGDYANRDAWTWTPVAGDKADGAAYPFGIDPSRTRAGACTMQVFGDHLYIGEYNDAEIAMMNMLFDSDFQFLADNLEQSVNLYRMDADENMELVMGEPTEQFPESLSGLHSGFGTEETAYENQYIWRMEVFQGKLYAGTFDQGSLLYPLAQFSNGDLMHLSPQEWQKQLDYILELLKMLQNQKEQNRPGPSAATLNRMVQEQERLEQFKSSADYQLSTVPAALNGTEMDDLVELHRAMVLLPALLEQDDSWTLEEKIASKINFLELYQQMMACYEGLTDVPAPLRERYEQILNPQKHILSKDLLRCLHYLEKAEQGFDMFVSEDGVHFDAITRSGMGDPYNQGLRALTYNDSAENPWLCVGTANPFYGTQIWRLEGEGLNRDTTYPIRAEHSENGQLLVPAAAAAGETVTIKETAAEGYRIMNLKVRDAQGKLLTLTPAEQGVTFKMPASAVEITAFFTAFRDIEEGAYYMDGVEWACENGIASGVSREAFAPFANCTRAQAVTFLWRSAGSPAPASRKNPFTDVKAEDYFYEAVLWAVENGVTTGTSDTTFSPKAACKRSEIATFLWRQAGSPAVRGDNPFTDVGESYYTQAVLWAVENDITTGTTAATFSPDANCTRGQIVTFLYRSAH